MDFVNYLEKISSVDIYALISFMIFFLIFIAITVWAFKTDKKTLNHMSNLPFDGETQNP
jgi:cbb3-type cytochrome oxidase subunit 3